MEVRGNQTGWAQAGAEVWSGKHWIRTQFPGANVWIVRSEVAACLLLPPVLLGRRFKSRCESSADLSVVGSEAYVSCMFAVHSTVISKHSLSCLGHLSGYQRCYLYQSLFLLLWQNTDSSSLGEASLILDLGVGHSRPCQGGVRQKPEAAAHTSVTNGGHRCWRSAHSLVYLVQDPRLQHGSSYPSLTCRETPLRTYLKACLLGDMSRTAVNLLTTRQPFTFFLKLGNDGVSVIWHS